MIHKVNSESTIFQKIPLGDIVISDSTTMLYEYTNHEGEISSLMESISEIGQQQPIVVIHPSTNYIIIDGVLRFKAIERLNLNEINAIVSDFTPTDEFSLTDYIIHNQIRKEKTADEKLNEVKALLRIDCADKNPLRDKDSRVKLVSYLLGGKGWGRNNVYSMEKILKWERDQPSDLQLSDQIVKNEINIKRALDAIDLTQSRLFSPEKEKESKIVKQFIKGSFNKEKAEKLMTVFDHKKSEGPTIVDIYPVKEENFLIIQGNAEEVELPADLLLDTIFTSPPYYKLRKYGSDPNELGWEKTPDLYAKRMADVLMKGFNKLKSTGSMFINLGESYDNFECHAVTDRLTIELINRGANFVDKIIWNKIANKPVSNQVKRLSPGYEVILHFSKTKVYYFERFRIQDGRKLKVSQGCKESQGRWNSYHIPNNYKQFRNVLVDSDVTNILTVQINQNRTEHLEGEQIHPATFTSNLPVIPLFISCPKRRDTVVFDPFMGSGSCGRTALLMGFKFVGVELYEENIVTARRILTESQSEFDEVALNNLFEEFGMITENVLRIAS